MDSFLWNVNLMFLRVAGVVMSSSVEQTDADRQTDGVGVFPNTWNLLPAAQQQVDTPHKVLTAFSHHGVRPAEAPD